MSRNIAHALLPKSSEFWTFYDKPISQYRKIARKNRIVEPELNDYTVEKKFKKSNRLKRLNSLKSKQNAKLMFFQEQNVSTIDRFWWYQILFFWGSGLSLNKSASFYFFYFRSKVRSPEAIKGQICLFRDFSTNRRITRGPEEL